MLIEQLTLTNFLSFGPKPQNVEFQPLSVFIGSNGSGKSNILDALDLLRTAPAQIGDPVSCGGGVSEWLWKGDKPAQSASIEAVVSYPNGKAPLRYGFSFLNERERFQLSEERIENAQTDHSPKAPDHEPLYFFKIAGGPPILRVKGRKRDLQYEDVDEKLSILSQRRDPEQYPEITHLAFQLEKIRIYQQWTFSSNSRNLLRVPQRADMPNHYLEPDMSNLGLVLSRLSQRPATRKKLVDELRRLYDNIDHFQVVPEGGSVQIFLYEGERAIPATRLSDGTLRYLGMLALLCDPAPPPLICIDEPELGLHPDLIGSLANLPRDASTRTQLVVTTHSDLLVDAMTDQPESVFVCEKHEGQTRVSQLSPLELAPWLEKYRLGELWTRGDIGGTRW